MRRGSRRCSVLAMVRSAGTEVPVKRSAAAEGLLGRARVLHAESERGALLRGADHVRGLDVDLVLAQPGRGARESSGFVPETRQDATAVDALGPVLRAEHSEEVPHPVAAPALRIAVWPRALAWTEEVT